jgi:hypothetical protein
MGDSPGTYLGNDLVSLSGLPERVDDGRPDKLVAGWGCSSHNREPLPVVLLSFICALKKSGATGSGSLAAHLARLAQPKLRTRDTNFSTLASAGRWFPVSCFD